MKKIFTFLTIFCLIFVLSLSVSAAEAVPYVDDQADILTEEEEQKLTELAKLASYKVDCGIYILTVDDFKALGYDTYNVEKVLKYYFRDHGYGKNADRSGVILMLSMSERDYSLFTNGFGDTGLSDPAMDYLVSSFLSDFGNNSWYNGFEDYINCTDKLLKMTIDGHPFDEHTPTPHEHLLGLFTSVLISFLLAGLITRHFVKAMKSVALGTEADEFAGSLCLKVNQNRYTHTTTTRVYDPPSSSGSGGQSGGGGGCSRSGKF